MKADPQRTQNSVAVNWKKLKSMSIDDLHQLEWRLLNPKQPTPSELKFLRLKDKILFGRLSRQMLKGEYSRRIPIYTSGEWFRWAAHAILVRPSFADAYYQRAITGTINAITDSANTYQREIFQHQQAYLGFDVAGREITYDFSYGIIDTEIVLRLNPEHRRASLLQGILIFETLKYEQGEHAQHGLLLARNLLEASLETSDDRRLNQRAGQCLEQIEAIIG
jgi:hypothetical protein